MLRDRAATAGRPPMGWKPPAMPPVWLADCTVRQPGAARLCGVAAGAATATAEAGRREWR